MSNTISKKKIQAKVDKKETREREQKQVIYALGSLREENTHVDVIQIMDTVQKLYFTIDSLVGVLEEAEEMEKIINEIHEFPCDMSSGTSYEALIHWLEQYTTFRRR